MRFENSHIQSLYSYNIMNQLPKYWFKIIINVVTAWIILLCLLFHYAINRKRKKQALHEKKSNQEKYNTYKMKKKQRYQRKKDAETAKQIKNMTAAQQNRKFRKFLKRTRKTCFLHPQK